MDLETSPYNSTCVTEVCVETFWAGTGSVVQDIALGIAPNAPVQRFSIPLMSEESVGAQSFSKVGLLWTTAPTIPTNFFRRVSGGVVTGGKFCIWTFPRGLIVAASASMVLWQIGTGVNNIIGGWAIDE